MRLLVLFNVFLYYCFVGVIQAAPTTNTTGITTSDSFKAPSFTTRTLWTIVSSSLLTLFACIYSAIHPNIPSPEDSNFRILLRRLGIMLMTLIAPELIVTWAMRQWFSARRVTRLMKDSGYPSVGPESEGKNSDEAPEQHENRFLRFLRLRCLPVVVLAKGGVTESIKAYFLEQPEDNAWTQTHSFFVLMGGFMLYVDGKPCLTLRYNDILKLIREKCIDVPTLTAKQIHDKNKGNAISKGLIMLQVAWFVMQLITRAIYHLETTQLEVGTLAFAVLNFLTYAVWWIKPLNVQSPHPVYWKSTEQSRPEGHIHDTERDDLTSSGILAPVSGPFMELAGLPNVPTSQRL
ncbi:hypothetical protein F4604DRAFT_1951256 [Suillus subluteus]|nr:hypothetical protein F4604DRAFT_1951256 [Suillus subluteus]